MKNNKKLIIIIVSVVVALVILFVLGICAFVGLIVKLADAQQIEDTNGEADKTLATITYEDIQSGSYSHATYMSSSSRTGRGASGVTGGYKDNDLTHSRQSAQKFSGICIENTCRGNGKTVQYKVESTVSSGNFQIFIVDENFQILKVVPIDQSSTVTIPTEAGKLYHVLYAGESAEIQVELWRTRA